MKIFNIILLKIIGIFIISNNINGVQGKTVMDNFNDGLKFAGQMFGINTAADVANLVAKAFSATATKKKPDIMSIFQRFDNNAENIEQDQQPTQEQQQQQQQQHYYQPASQEQTDNEQQANVQSERNGEALPTAATPLSGFNAAGLITSILKMIGFDAGKLGALALNALIMVAQAIGSTLMGNAANRKRVVAAVEGGRLSSSDNQAANSEEASYAHEPRIARSGNPIDWFMENPNKEMRALIGDITDVKLSDRLTSMIEQIESEPGQGACIKMLMCKSSPFIWGMQKSLAKRLNNTSSDNEQKQQPEEEEVQKQFMNVNGFFTHLPSIEEFRHHGAKCEQRYSSHCNTTNVYNH